MEESTNRRKLKLLMETFGMIAAITKDSPYMKQFMEDYGNDWISDEEAEEFEAINL